MAERSRPDRGRSIAAAALAATGLAGAAVLAALPGRPVHPPVDPAALRDKLDQRLAQLETQLHDRLAKLAGIPRLAAAVSTDPRTVADLTEEELALRPRPGEIMLLAQIPRQGVPVVLRVLPAGAAVPPVERDGPRIHLVAGRPALCDSVAVRPVARAEELHGVLAVSTPFPVDDLVEPVSAARSVAWLEAGSSVMALVPLPTTSPARWHRAEAPMRSRAATGLQLVVAVAARSETTYFTMAGLLAGASLLLAWWLFSSGRRSGPTSLGLPLREPIYSPTPVPADGAPASLPLLLSDPSLPGMQLPAQTAPDHAAGEITSAPPGGNGSAEPTPDPLPAPPPPPPPPTARITWPTPPPQRTSVGPYEILKLLDAGGTAEVYLARAASAEPDGDKLVALKVLQSAFARQPEVVELFLDEARLAALVNHPNVVQVLDVGRASDQYFLAMEFVDGSNLDRLRALSHRAARQIPISVALTLLCRICAGLHAAHTATTSDGKPLGLIHRDVKGANVLVGRNGVVKIGDFGIARASHVLRVRRTDLGIVRGTPGHMAPEQRMGQPLDQRTDVFGLGVIGYELMSGVPLSLDPLAPGAEGWPDLTPPSALRSGMPEGLDRVIMRALAFDRDERFQDCALLQAALEEVATRHPLASEESVASWVEGTLATEVMPGVPTIVRAGEGTRPPHPQAR